MKQAISDKKTGIQWTFTKQLEDLDFADDISLLSHRHQDAQEKLSRLAEEAEKTDLEEDGGDANKQQETRNKTPSHSSTKT